VNFVSDNVYIVKGDRNTLKALKVQKPSPQNSLNQITSTLPLKFPTTPTIASSGVVSTSNRHGTKKGSGVTAAVIDTGISQVPDLKDTKFVKGYDFVNDRVEADDDNGHGTHVAGTIAQSTNNGYGVAGIAYQASLMPLKVLSNYGGGCRYCGSDQVCR